MLRPRTSGTVPSLLGTLFLLAACGADKSADPATSTNEPESACQDGKDNDRDGHADCDDLDCRIAGNACALAPPVDRSVASTLAETASFLYAGPDPLQKGADAKAFNARRIAMLRGRVVDRAGEPLAGVRVTISGHPEYGYTLTRPDGLFDLAVNGGARLVVEYEKGGFLQAERVTEPAWQRYARLPEVGLVEASEHRATVATEAAALQALVGERVEDDFGSRQPLVLFESSTKATAVRADGSEVKLDALTVSVTEYPFEQGSLASWTKTPRFAPGTLPSTNGLHYGLEFSVEKAKELGAKTVRFSATLLTQPGSPQGPSSLSSQRSSSNRSGPGTQRATDSAALRSTRSTPTIPHTKRYSLVGEISAAPEMSRSCRHARRSNRTSERVTASRPRRTGA